MNDIVTTIKATQEQIDSVAKYYGWDGSGSSNDFAIKYLSNLIIELISKPAKNNDDQKRLEEREQMHKAIDNNISQLVDISIYDEHGNEVITVVEPELVITEEVIEQ